MRKKVVQLSLFDKVPTTQEKSSILDKEFERVLNTKNNQNGNEQNNQRTNNRQELHGERDALFRGEEPVELDRKKDIRVNTGTPTGSFLSPPGGKGTNTANPQDLFTISQRDRELESRGVKPILSSGNSMETSNEGSRTRSYLDNFNIPIEWYSEKNSSFSVSNRLKDNLNALKTLVNLKDGKRPATQEEKKLLAKYVGWGGIKQILLNPDKDQEWKVDGDKSLRSLIKETIEQIKFLDPEGKENILNSARASILNAHYTPYGIINAMFQSLEILGFKGGKILEPAAGIGNFLGVMPEAMAGSSEVMAIEKDRLSGLILKYLYPTAYTQITAYEKTAIPLQSQDLIISNVPFGDIRVYDSSLPKSYALAANNLHNYFFSKALTHTKPGGLIAFITSRYTLDADAAKPLRELMNETCNFVSAIRLPDKVFTANAGTSVVADIIFLQKKDLGQTLRENPGFLNVLPKRISEGKNSQVFYNEYFHSHPENMIGTIGMGGMYRKDEFALTIPSDKIHEIPQKIVELFGPFKNHPIYSAKQKAPVSNTITEGDDFLIKQDKFEGVGNLKVINGTTLTILTGEYKVNPVYRDQILSAGVNIYAIEHSEGKISKDIEEKLISAGIPIDDVLLRVAERVRASQTNIKRVNAQIELRNQTKRIIWAETSGLPDIKIEQWRKELNENYQKYVRKHGYLRSKENESLSRKDADNYIITSLEVMDPETKKITPSDILSKRTIFPKKEIQNTDSIEEAVAMSQQKFGKINTNYISELMNKPFDKILEETYRSESPYIFKAINGEFQPREEYLSGNVVKKLDELKKLAPEQNDAYFKTNVLELQKVQPTQIDASEIYVPLNVRWLPKAMISEFVNFITDTEDTGTNLSYSAVKDEYTIPGSGRISAKLDGFATERRTGKWILEHALNGVEPKVTYIVKDENGSQRTVFDAKDTQLAKQNYRQIRDAWDDWKYSEYDRRSLIQNIYNKQFNNIVLRDYNGQHLTFPGLTGYTLRAHQKDATFRNIQQFGGINDHRVGAGKTLIEITTAMELKRLGLANKPLIIGLKSQIPQLYQQFKTAYPLSKVLYPTSKDFQKTNRRKLLNTIATNDWDCIILSHDQFNMIEQSPKIQMNIIEEMLDKIRDELDSMDDKITKKSLIKRMENYRTKLDKLTDIRKDKRILDFSKLGIDFLIVDESQEYKNLEFITQKRNIKGLGNPSGSKKAFNLLIAARYLQELHGGDKGILFSSGTPISNTMAELYLLMKYLRPTLLKEQGLTSFDRWASVFANDYSDLEYYMGKFKEVHRFREFVNLPELIKSYREIADVRNDFNLKLPQPHAFHELVKLQPLPQQVELINKLQDFIDTKGNAYKEELGLTKGYDSNKGSNPSYALLAINFAKKISMDPRLIDPYYEPGAKLLAAADKIAQIYQVTNSYRGTQLVFSDIGTPKAVNKVDNLYDYLAEGTPQADLDEIFGSDYYDKKTKPTLQKVSTAAAKVLSLDNEEVQELIKEANEAAPFDVYNELKDLLVARGIPEREIAFIHSYNTSKQKEELYKKTNDGQIRVLIGSTKKLGTGVNVQQRAVAAHHLDIQWRPSDLEQRNGRIIRQGNWASENFLHNKVKVFYYATERTLDASMYNTVSQKANFINQLKTSADPAKRVAKDIQEDIDISTMAAELSGNPLFKERAHLIKDIDKLELLQKAFLTKQYSIENKIRREQADLDKVNDRAALLKKVLPHIQSLPKTKDGQPIFNPEFGGKTYDKVGTYSKALIQEIEYNKKYARPGATIDLGALWGFRITANIRENFSGDKKASLNIISPQGTPIYANKEQPEGEIATGLFIKQSILNVDKEIQKSSEYLAKHSLEITEYERQLSSEFGAKKELLEKKSRLTEVNREITELSKKETDNEKEITQQVKERMTPYKKERVSKLKRRKRTMRL